MSERRFIATTAPGLARVDEDDTPVRSFDYEHVRCVAVGPPGTDLVFAGGDGLYRSTDRGETWEESGLTGRTVSAIAVAPSDPNRVYAGVRPPGVYRSDDGGKSWTACDGFNRIRGRRLWRSPADASLVAYVQALAVSPTDPDVLAAGIEFGAVIRSTDGGTTWSNHRRRAIRDCHSLVWHARDETTVYEGGAGFWKRPGAVSTDSGQSWVKPGGGLTRGYGWAVAAHPERTDIWYVSASSGPSAAHGGKNAKAHVYRRIGDRPWVRLERLPGDDMPYALCTDPSEPDALWVGMHRGALWHSPDRGETWTRLESSLPKIERSMVMLPPS